MRRNQRIVSWHVRSSALTAHTPMEKFNRQTILLDIFEKPLYPKFQRQFLAIKKRASDGQYKSHQYAFAHSILIYGSNNKYKQSLGAINLQIIPQIMQRSLIPCCTVHQIGPWSITYTKCSLGPLVWPQLFIHSNVLVHLAEMFHQTQKHCLKLHARFEEKQTVC